MDADGQNQERLTFHASSDVDPAISPDGRDIIFTSNRSGNNEIFIADTRGGTPVNLTNHSANDGWARWSPDGHYIVFHSNRDQNDFEIYVMDRTGGSVTRLTNRVGIDQYPDWSPNGKSIVYRRDLDLWVMDLPSGDVTQLTSSAGLNQMAAWSPNGHQLVFMSNRAGYPSVFTIDADGSNPTNLTPKAPADSPGDWVSRAPSWSTNGRHIYFMSRRPATGGDVEAFVMNDDGSEVQRLTFSIGDDGSPRAR